MPSISRELDLVDPVFAKLITADLVATLGRERVEKHLNVLDSVVRQRIAGGLEITASDYVTMVRRCASLVAAAAERMRGFDAWITPTSPTIPLPVPSARRSPPPPRGIGAPYATRGRATSSVSVEFHCRSDRLARRSPLVCRLLGSGGDDARLLAIALAVEDTLRH